MTMSNRRPRILLGVTGSVAAVKVPKLALRLANEVKADVKVVLTRTVEQYFWKDGRAVSTYDGESWREILAATSSSTTSEEVDEKNDSWRLSKGSISIHCEWVFPGIILPSPDIDAYYCHLSSLINYLITYMMQHINRSTN